MNSDPFYTFLAFVTQDTAIVQGQKKQAIIERKIQEKKSTLHAQQELLREAQQQAHDAKKRVDAQELEIKVVRERQRSLKNKLDSAASPKEYFSLESEIKAVAAELDTHENKLFELFEVHESLEKKAGELDFQVVTLRDTVNNDCAQLAQELHELQKELEDHQGIYDELKHHVNPEMLEKFLSMKEMIENPVVPVEKNACSACFTGIPAQDLVAINKHKLVPCKDCFRLLYSAS